MGVRIVIELEVYVKRRTILQWLEQQSYQNMVWRRDAMNFQSLSNIPRTIYENFWQMTLATVLAPIRNQELMLRKLSTPGKYSGYDPGMERRVAGRRRA